MNYIKEFTEKNSLAEATAKTWFDISKPYLPTNQEFLDVFSPAEEYSSYGRTVYTRFSWAALTKENINLLLDLLPSQPILEVGAGVGWLAYWLNKHGVNIIPTDAMYWSKKHDYREAPVNIERLSASAAIKKYNDIETILCCWPPYKSRWPNIIQKNWLNMERTMLFIGEEYGCTAQNKFFDGWNPVKRFNDWTRFWGMHDCLFVLKEPTNDRTS